MFHITGMDSEVVQAKKNCLGIYILYIFYILNIQIACTIAHTHISKIKPYKTHVQILIHAFLIFFLAFVGFVGLHWVS